MNQTEFSQLLSSLNTQKTSQNRKTLIQTAAVSSNSFTCAQVALILENLKFTKDQLQFLKILRPRISDIENAFQIIKVFSYTLEKKKAGDILGQPEYIETAVRGKQVSEASAENMPAAIPKESFSQLLDALSKQRFPKEQLYLVELAVFRNTFTSEQIAQILEKFQFPRYQLKALNLLRYRITDSENNFLILNAFSNSLQKKRASALLRGIAVQPEMQPAALGFPNETVSHSP
jgi:hypothetical protein